MSICCTSSPRARADLAGLADRPLDQHVGAGSADVVGQVALDDVHEEHPALGPVVDAAPGPDVAVGVAQHDVLARPQPVLGHLDQYVVDRRRRPSRGRAARGRAAAGSAGRRRTGRTGRAPDRPPVGKRRVVGSDLVGVALEPAVLGDHDPRFCRTPDTTLTRPRVSDGSACSCVTASGVPAVRLGLPGGQLRADRVDLLLQLGDAERRLGGTLLGLLEPGGVRRGPRARRRRPGGPRR